MAFALSLSCEVALASLKSTGSTKLLSLSLLNAMIENDYFFLFFSSSATVDVVTIIFAQSKHSQVAREGDGEREKMCSLESAKSTVK